MNSSPAPILNFREHYIAQAGEGETLDLLQKQQSAIADLITSLTPAQLNSQYAPGKWTLAELIGHCMDTERIQADRGFRFSRGDQTPQPGFEQDDYIQNGRYHQYTIEDFLHEFNALRANTIASLRALSPEMLGREGEAASWRAPAWKFFKLVVGHWQHHRSIIRERYLISPAQ